MPKLSETEVNSIFALRAKEYDEMRERLAPRAYWPTDGARRTWPSADIGDPPLTDYQDDIEETHDDIGQPGPGTNWALWLLGAAIAVVLLLAVGAIVLIGRWDA